MRECNKVMLKGENSPSGFALISTILVMSLLLLVSLGMMSLSSVETRTTNSQRALSEAKANARMALIIALAELQEAAGPDQRITASSKVLGDATASYSLTGVWKSVGADVSGTLSAAKMVDEYKSSYSDKTRGGRFLKWLVSGDQKVTQNLDYPNSSLLESDYAELVGTKSLEGMMPEDLKSNFIVRAKKIPVTSSSMKGSYAWWIGDEGVKARVNLTPPANTNDSIATKLNQAVAATSLDTQMIDSVKDMTVEQLDRLSSMESLDVKGVDSPSKTHFFDLTTYSRSLLTNTTRGGLQKDLTLLTEKDVLPNALSGVAMDTGVSTWDTLYDYCRLYKPYDAGGILKWDAGQPVIFLGPTFQTVGENLSKWKQFLPTVSKAQVLISHYSVRDPDEGSYQLRATIDKQTELWNRFNLPMELVENTNFHMKWWTMPLGMKYHRGGTVWKGSVWDSTIDSRGVKWNVFAGGDRKAHFKLNGRENRLAAGEVRFYSDSETGATATDRNAQPQFYYPPEGFGLEAGLYTNDIGHYTGSPDKGAPGHDDQRPPVLRGTAGITVEPELKHYPWTSSYGRQHFIDTWVTKNGNDGGYKYVGEISTSGATQKSTAEILTDDNDYDHEFTLGDVVGVANKKPFVLFGMRLRTEKSFSNSTGKTLSERMRVKHNMYSHVGTFNTSINNDDLLSMTYSPYEYFVQPIEGNIDNVSNFIPVAADGDRSNKGFLGSSNETTGQSYLAQDEVPIMPLISLAQLQHAPIGNTGDYYPYLNNSSGNSFESPFVSATEIEEKGAISPRDGVRTTLYDKSWIANETLWGSYFFSGIAAKDIHLYSEAKSQEEVLSEAVSGVGLLPNTRLILTEKGHEVMDYIGDADDYKKVGGALIREGAFNVNSTSVLAWKSFLGSLDNKTLVYLNSQHHANGIASSLFEDQAIASTEQLAVSRFTLPIGEYAETGEPDFIEQRWKGARILSDSQLDNLAENIVDEVQLRGPFISLSEFINRRLSDDAMSENGALQEAIDNTDINASFAGSSALSGTSETVLGSGIGEADIGALLANKDAGSGLNGQGATGYVTQADLLMPLAPSLTVRSDTFKIRTYGESLRVNGEVAAQAWCEIIVQRTADYMSAEDASTAEIVSDTGLVLPDALNAVNSKYGRRFKIVSFRWLSSNEI